MFMFLYGLYQVCRILCQQKLTWLQNLSFDSSSASTLYEDHVLGCWSVAMPPQN
jgi:hypothetical protein